LSLEKVESILNAARNFEAETGGPYLTIIEKLLVEISILKSGLHAIQSRTNLNFAKAIAIETIKDAEKIEEQI